MKNFKPGQKIVCTAKGKWTFTQKNIGFWKSLFKRFRHGYGPTFNEIVTVEEISDGYLRLIEYPLTDNDGARYTFNPDNFEPLVQDSVLEKELASIPEFLETINTPTEKGG